MDKSKLKSLWLKYLKAIKHNGFKEVPTLTSFCILGGLDYEEVSGILETNFIRSTQRDILLEGALVGRYTHIADMFRKLDEFNNRDDGLLSALISDLQYDEVEDEINELLEQNPL